MGMVIERSGDFDIGHGFFMNDYIMVRPLHDDGPTPERTTHSQTHC